MEVPPSSLPAMQRVLLAGLGLLLVIGLGVWGGVESQRTSAWMQRTAAATAQLERAHELQNAVVLMESRQRGFLLQGDRRLLALRDADYRRALDLLAALRTQARGDTEQSGLLDAAEVRVRARHAQMTAVERIAVREGLEAARWAAGGEHAQGFGPIQALLQRVVAEEDRLLAAHREATAATARRFQQAEVVGGVAAMLLLLATVFALWRQLRRGERLRTALGDAEALQRAILDGAGYMVIATDPNGVITLFNRAAAETLGYAPEELVGRATPERLHVAEEVQARAAALSTALGRPVAPGFEAFVAKARAGGTDIGEWTYVSRDGRRFPVQLAVSAVRAPDNRLLGFVGIAEDISARRAAERQLRELEAQLREALAFNRLVMDNSLDVICAIDGDGRFVAVSAASRTLWGYAPEELVGRRYIELVHPDDLALTEQEAARIIAGQATRSFSNRYLARDGRVVDVDWSAVWSPRERLMFCVARDAAERRAQEARIRQLNADLEAQAIELRQSNRELEAFSYTISHDLRAPLRHIDGYARMLAEDAGPHLDGECRRYLDEIGAAARRMGQLIDDLLAFSRSGRKAVERTRVDMTRLAREVARELGGEARVQVAALPEAAADPVLLRQVWVNLIANALKYSAPRGEAARIEIDGEADGERLRYRVRDNGVGFDMRYADKLFGVFQRLHTQEEFEGTGVGLAIVERILARHGGSIRAHAEPGRGAEFTFELPRVHVPAPEPTS